VAAMYSWSSYTPHLSALLATPGVTMNAIQDHFESEIESGEVEPGVAMAAVHYLNALKTIPAGVLATFSKPSAVMSSYRQVIEENPGFYTPANDLVDAVAEQAGEVVGNVAYELMLKIAKLVKGTLDYFGVDKLALGYVKSHDLYLPQS